MFTETDWRGFGGSNPSFSASGERPAANTVSYFSVRDGFFCLAVRSEGSNPSFFTKNLPTMSGDFFTIHYSLFIIH